MAFRIAVSGLRAATADLDVTGNNIANSNTTGFKASRAQFADLYAASDLGTAQGAIGQGVQLAAVAQQFTQGNVGFTDNSLDIAINGGGFFVVEDSNGRAYSRAGAFGLDEDGYMVNATGHRLQAFQAVNGSITGAVGPLQISTTNIAPQATSAIIGQVNLDAGAGVPPNVATFDPADPNSYNNSTSMTIFDSLGQEHLASIFYAKTAANSWQARVGVDGNFVNGPAALAFDNSGNLTTAMPLTFGSFPTTTGSLDIDLSVDLTGTTQYGADFGVNALAQDGFTTGRLSGIDTDQDGVVLARFSNGQSQAQGQIVLADFSNAQGLQPQGDTLWAETASSGAALVGAPGTATLGLLQAGALEESNVDLAEQLVNMIVAQRAFQANAQVIRTEDEVTQTIINIR
jgi:flagellar hook protein FlgE